MNDGGRTRGAGAKERPMDGASIARRWAEYLVAILAGNIIYLFIEPQLPAVMRHRMFRVDLGLGLDFVICAVIYGLVRQIRFFGDGAEED
jgi:hypothetical protein